MASPGNLKMEDIYFYHSFGRGKDLATGLRMFESFLRHGILLTAEVQRFPATRNLAEKEVVQKRTCFTAIPARELTAFAKGFGPFALEFEGQELREFGVLPVVYSAGWIPGGALMDKAGAVLARQWLESYLVMAELVRFMKTGDVQEKAVAEKIWMTAERAKLPPEELQYSLQALMNLNYPTDEFGGGEFGYFKEREWRIVPNLALEGGEWLYPSPDAAQAKELCDMDPEFYNRVIGGKPQIEHCAFLRDIAGRSVVKRARRFIVPPETVDAAKELAGKWGCDPHRVVPGDLPEFSE